MVQSTAGLGLGVTPIGPTWDIHHYFLGADEQGRDVAARLLYGGRNSLLIGDSRGADHVLPRRPDRRRRGLLRRPRRRHALALPRPDLGVPRLPARDQPLDRADRARGLVRAVPPRVREPAAADHDHRPRLHPVRRTADSRRGSLDPAPRVRRGGDRARRVELAAALERRAPERDHDGDRAVPADARDRHADRGGAVVPLDRRAGAAGELGDDHPRRAGRAVHAADGRARSRASRSR